MSNLDPANMPGKPLYLRLVRALRGEPTQRNHQAVLARIVALVGPEDIGSLAWLINNAVGRSQLHVRSLIARMCAAINEGDQTEQGAVRCLIPSRLADEIIRECASIAMENAGGRHRGDAP